MTGMGVRHEEGGTVSDQVGDDSVRRRDWTVLRRLVEASNLDVVRALWPNGDSSTPAEVSQLIWTLKNRPQTLPATLRRISADRIAAAEVAAMDDLEWSISHGWRLITPDDREWPSEKLDQSFGALGDLDSAGDSVRRAEPSEESGTGGQTERNEYRKQCETVQGFSQLHTGDMHSTADGIRRDGIRGRAARPFALWAKGSAQLAVATDRSIALVGTRSKNTYGERMTRQFAAELAAVGYTVISGGAVGIDTAAHRGALDSAGTTLVVAASGPGDIYPRGNAVLFRSIAETGLVISEYPPHQNPARHRFLTRNRLVAALTRGTVVLAAGYRSGALNTANWADAMLRPVMVLPGPADSPAYAGCHRRLREGSGVLITRSAEIREIVEPLGSVDSEAQLSLDFAASQTQQISRDQLAVFDACGIASDASGTIEEISVDAGLAPGTVVHLLGELVGLGLIVRSGDRWIKTDR